VDDEDIYPLDPFTWRERIRYSGPAILVLAGWTWVYRRWDDFFTYHWLTWFPRWYDWFPPKKPDDVPRETSTD
jgi:hypothetical protein